MSTSERVPTCKPGDDDVSPVATLVHLPPRQGFAVQRAVSKAPASFWSALNYFARHDRPVPARGWDRGGGGS
jgi:hypothetical protein